MLWFGLLELLEACAKVHGLGWQHEAAEVVVLALHGHAAAQAGAHGANGGAASTTGGLAGACKADAQRALAPVEVVVLLVGIATWHGRLELQAFARVGGQLEVVAPVVVDNGHLLGRGLLAQTLDGAAQQGRRGHARRDRDASLLRGSRDGGRVGGPVVGRDQELPVILRFGFGAHAHAR